MATITLKGNPITTVGELPKVGTAAPDFRLVKGDLSEVSLKDFAGKKLVLNIFPSVDTPTCAASVRRFNVEAAKQANVVVLCVSRDLPFAHKRFCAAEGIDQVHGVSDMRDSSFGKAYGVRITSGPIADLFSRAVVVVDANGKVAYTEQVGEVANEPDYTKVLAALA